MSGRSTSPRQRSDLTPELFDTGRQLAAQRGESLKWRQAEADGAALMA